MKGQENILPKGNERWLHCFVETQMPQELRIQKSYCATLKFLRGKWSTDSRMNKAGLLTDHRTELPHPPVHLIQMQGWRCLLKQKEKISKRNKKSRIAREQACHSTQASEAVQSMYNGMGPHWMFPPLFLAPVSLRGWASCRCCGWLMDFLR